MSSKSLNKVTLIGNVTRDPELRYTPQGNAVCTFGLATNRSWKTEGGEIREEAEFHRLVAWNKLAELCSQLCSKGRKIYVEGRLQTRTFTGSDNAQHTITEIVIDDMILLDSKFAQAGGGYQGGQATSPAPVGPVASAAPATAPDDGGKKSKTRKGKGEKAEEVKAEGGKTGETEAKEEVIQDASEAKEPFGVSQGKPAPAKAAMGEDVNIDDIPF